MSHLSSSIAKMKSHYTVVVVGSGYGGGIAASRMARAGKDVCVLERGKEFQPGEYPDTEVEAVEQMQIDLPNKHVGHRTGLYDIRVNDHINVFVGCGLGGTSLVNANVVIRAEPRVFADPVWPAALQQDVPTLLEEGYRRAEEMLKPTPYPAAAPALPKLKALEQSANFMGEKFYRPNIAVNFQEGDNHVGVSQHACKLCGDCITGCNHAAKNTTLMNYLPDAHNHGAEIYTQVAVRYLERKDGRWLVHYQLLDHGREKFDAPTMFVSADVVILGAGTLGSTEILLRSKQNGLTVSERLGKGFSGNGDVLGFGYNADQDINAIGYGHRSPENREPVGPCISGIIDIREQPELNEGMVIEEGSVPGALSAVMPLTLAGAAKAFGKDTDTGVADFLKESGREVASLVRGAYHGAVNNTQVFLVMTHDDANGEMFLDDDRLRIWWPEVGKQPIFKKVEDRLLEATRALGGTFVKNPIWSKLAGHDLVTVHPLGGCAMAEEATSGAVNHKGQVFSAAQGEEVYDSLYVCDGAVIPRSIGTNPLLTISALAERCCALIAKDRNWTIDYALPSAPLFKPEPERPGVQFTETMKGFFSTKITDDYAAAAAQGEKDRSTFEFTLTIQSDDLESMLADAQHAARMAGTVEAPALSAAPLTVAGGQFNLFTVAAEAVGTRQMRYRMQLRAVEGKTYYFSGFKTIHDDPGFDLWADTTTLFITVHQGDNEQGAVIGKGILKIAPGDFLKQMTTMQVTNAHNAIDRMKGMAKFGQFFAGSLYEVFGGVLARSNWFNADATPRKKRPLRVGAPEVHFFKANDGVQLRLTRYRGGEKGPVMLVHGLGVSSRIFSIDTIEANLLEYLYAHGYDVWLLDNRVSIELPSASQLATADDVATKDYPAAVDTIRQLTGAPAIDAVVHCYGSTTFFMAMLAGLQGVRSAVCSQIGAHIVAPTMTKVKTGLHLPSFLKALGVKSLTAYVDEQSDWQDKLFNQALKLQPLEAEERCNNPVCHRISFLYSLLYEHDQLNTATHEALHEMFGIANIAAFQQLAELTRAGHLVSASGEEVYLPHVERLAIPLTFIHGEENDCFRPKSTELTYDWLREANGNALYRRHVIPGYGHIDCIFGKDAAVDVYPFILEHLERQ